jgi:hypothetical protein
MSDWNYLNKCRVTTAGAAYSSTAADGFNGFFSLRLNGLGLTVIASNGEGWLHVSVSIQGSRQPPSWSIMCQVKDLFFEPEDWVVQFHPAKSEYVNFHEGVLHLWKSLDKEMPTPPWFLVGPK